MHTKNGIETESVKVLYFDRWWLLICILILDLVNRGHCIAFVAVTNKAAEYYDQTGDTIDLIVIVSSAIVFPFYFICAYVVEAWGLKTCLRFGATLTAMGRRYGLYQYYIIIKSRF